MPEEPRTPLSPVQEEVAGNEITANFTANFDFRNDKVALTPGPKYDFGKVVKQATLTKRAVVGFKRPLIPENHQGESSFTSAVSSRIQTENGSDVARIAQQLPVVDFRDNLGPLAKATPDGVGGWSVEFARIVSLGMADRTQVQTAIKSVAACLVIAGETLKQSGDPSANIVKIAGNVTMSLTQLLDMVNYGTSAWETAKNDGLRAAVPDMRKAILQAISMGGVITAAVYQQGDNSVASAAAMGMSTLAAMSATGPSKVEERAKQEDAAAHFFRNPGALESQIHLPGLGGAQSQLTVSMVTESIRTETARNSAPASIRSVPGGMVPGGMGAMLPPRRTNTSQSVESSATTPAAAAVREPPPAKGKKRMQ